MKLNEAILLGLLWWLTCVSAAAQVETVPVQVQKYGPREVEEFNVLKANKKVRHGAYVRYMPRPSLGTVLFETGSYDRGQREGQWRLYSEDRPWTLISIGNYHAGVKEGIWTYYHRFVSSPATVNSNVLRTVDSVFINDTTALVQAQGFYAQGRRVGIWTYFDRQKQVVQKVDHFTNQLLYWRPAANVPATSISATDDHPLLYAGGKSQLQVEVLAVLGPFFAIDFDKSKSAEFIFQVEATGKQLGVMPAEPTNPTRYEKQLLQALTKVPPYWVPQVVDGRPAAAQYRVRVSVEVETEGNRKKARTVVEPLDA